MTQERDERDREQPTAPIDGRTPDGEPDGVLSAPQTGHPSQAEGEDPAAREGDHPDPATRGFPSQAEGDDRA
ncbi:hypothetical protein GCM10011490_11940 [Pseudoclavibacter endophyticus]|uniref:Uncharacterized protein n=1 Tax=Pseudoclavibacter endophyticus TaxID=1778590 RepID=A0A6H9WR12_9MICO|nr:hypothetical protein [Pseudoclavibacter endophyticus]KAB1649387.1 hypothetical protein F8O04_03720 [Pseudoclavibacter endophyticus]GGA63031.1 hypothetical protein GCM10011490_11940 [Pseudoclavibacter endophyticus]